MRWYDLPNGETVDLDAVTRVSPVHVCKHDSQYNNFEIYLHQGESVNMMVNLMTREEFMEILNGAS